jgi:hypothetical protein
MKKLLFLLLVANMMLFTSCSSSDSDDEPQTKEELLQKEIVGKWLFSDNYEINIVSLNSDGTGILNSLVYSSKTWTVTESTLLYTLSGEKATFKVANGDTWSGNIAITGISMSLTDSDGSTILTKYDGNENQINELKQYIEESYDEYFPTETPTEDNIFNSETQINAYVNNIYLLASKFQLYKLQLESIRTTGKDLDGRSQESISSTTSYINNAWESAYNVVSQANVGIASLDDSKYHKIRNEIIVLRDWTYLNMLQLWGKVCVTSVTDIFSSTIYDKAEMMPKIEEEIKEIDSMPNTEGHLTDGTLQGLRTEIALELGKNTEAVVQISTCNGSFDCIFGDNLNLQIPSILENKISIYSVERMELLKKEALGDISNLATAWENLGSNNYGYWAMLVRTNQATTITGCKDFELLMPIPMSEIQRNPNIKQNPGY